jgi:2-dehydropantoate 2-reductase
MTQVGEIRNIVIIGVGGVGGYFGGRLARTVKAAGARAGRSVSFLARGPHGDAIRSGGLRLQTAQGEELLCRPDLVTDDPAELPAPDLCLLCVKAYDLPAVLEPLAPRLPEHAAILPLLNGVDIYDRVLRLCPQGLVLPACAYVSANIEAPGIVRQRGQEGTILLGPDPRRPGHDAPVVRALLSEAKIRHIWSGDPFPGIWQKYLFIAAFGIVTAWSGKSMGEVLADRELTGLVREIMAEVLALARARNVRLPAEAAEQVLEKARSFPPETRTSYQRDVEAGGRNEGELFGGTILRLGRELGIPVPVTEGLHLQIPGPG